MQPGCGHRWFLVLSLLTDLTLAVAGGGVASLRGVAEGGDWGRGTLSCLTRVRSVRILAIMKREGLPGPLLDSDRRLIIKNIINIIKIQKKKVTTILFVLLLCITFAIYNVSLRSNGAEPSIAAVKV